MMFGKFHELVKSWLFWLPLLVRSIGKLLGFVFKPWKGSKSHLDRYWGMLSHFQRNLIIGTVIAFIIHLGHGTSWVRNMEDFSVDWMNKLQVDTVRLAGNGLNTGQPGYTFIDIDEPTFNSWGEPFHVPRDKLTRLIRYAAEGEAKVIIVDVDLSTPGTQPQADKELVDYLRKYRVDASDLILVRTFGPTDENKPGLPPVRKAFFDTEINSTSIYWAHPLFSLDESDLRIRRWRLVEAGCLDGQPAWLPSPQLMVVVLSEIDRNGWAKLKKNLKDALPSDCSGYPDLRNAKLHLQDRQIDPWAHGIEQRMIYSFSNQLRIGNKELNYHRVSARLITESNDPISTDLVRGKIVIIGASNATSRDIHHTPVGTMPGALIITNAVKSLQQFGQLQGPPGWVKLMIEGVLIILMAWAFAHFNSIGGIILTGIAVALVLVPISFYFFKYGIWIDLAAPILGMQLHEVVANYEDALAMKHQLKKQESD